MTSVINTGSCCLDSRPVIDLFNDNADDDDDGDIFKQISSPPSAENAASTTAKHKV